MISSGTVLNEGHVCAVYAKQEILDAATARLQTTQRGAAEQGTGSIRTRILPSNTNSVLKGLGFDETDVIFMNFTHYY